MPQEQFEDQIDLFYSELNDIYPSTVVVWIDDDPKSIVAKALDFQEDEALRKVKVAKDKELEIQEKYFEEEKKEFNEYIKKAPECLSGAKSELREKAEAIMQENAPSRVNAKAVVEVYK